MRNLIARFQERLGSFLKNKMNSYSGPKISRVPLSGEAIDLETAQNPDHESHVKFYTTENAQAAKGAEKSPGYGLDKFGGEDDTVHPDAGIDTNKNSDLSERYF